MSPLDLVRLAIARLRSSRLRAALTMLGVIIGVASVVALVAVGQGATRGITSEPSREFRTLRYWAPATAGAARRARSESETSRDMEPFDEAGVSQGAVDATVECTVAAATVGRTKRGPADGADPRIYPARGGSVRWRPEPAVALSG